MSSRILRDDICTSDKIDSLGFGFAECLFYRLIVHADDFGYFDARPSIILGTLFPIAASEARITRDEIVAGLNQLHDAELIKLYRDGKNGKWYGEIYNFNQRVRTKRRKHPAPEDEGMIVGHMSDTCQSSADKCGQVRSNAASLNPSYSKHSQSPRKKFTPPTEDDVREYFRENGYSREVGSQAFKYYDEAGWKDSTGKPVKNWKQKMRGVWFRDEHLNKGSDTEEHFI